MEVIRQLLLDALLLGTMSLTSGAAIMVLHGLLMHRRLRNAQPITECVTQRAWLMLVAAGLFSLLLLTQAKTVPWDWLGTLTLLVATAPSLLVWLGPPDEHVEASDICQIGKGSAYNHFYGYLRLMQSQHAIRPRLENFQRGNQSGLSPEEPQDLYTKALVVPAPMDGEYPSGSFEELSGIGKEQCKMPSFQCTVGGNKRSYGGFSIHEVTSSNAGGQKCYVAMERVGALATLKKLRQHGPAGLGSSECQRQMREMLDELEKIVEESTHLRGQLKVVRYNPGEHVGDAILAEIQKGQD